MAARGPQSLRLCGRIADGLLLSNMCSAGFAANAVAAVAAAADQASPEMAAIMDGARTGGPRGQTVETAAIEASSSSSGKKQDKEQRRRPRKKTALEEVTPSQSTDHSQQVLSPRVQGRGAAAKPQLPT